MAQLPTPSRRKLTDSPAYKKVRGSDACISYNASGSNNSSQPSPAALDSVAKAQPQDYNGRSDEEERERMKLISILDNAPLAAVRWAHACVCVCVCVCGGGDATPVRATLDFLSSRRHLAARAPRACTGQSTLLPQS